MSKISFEGIGEITATFRAGAEIMASTIVKISGNGEVAKCGVGDAFCGVVVGGKDGCAAVQVGGLATIPVSGTVGTGWVKLSADGLGGARVDTAGNPYLVLTVDTAINTAVVRM